MRFDVDEKMIAFCVDKEFEDDCKNGPGYYFECLKLLDVKVTREGWESYPDHRYVVSFDVNKYDVGGCVPPVWEFATDDFTTAYDKFKEAAGKSNFGKVFLCDKFESKYGCLYDDGTPCSPSSSSGDYGPGNPWDAPGMSVSDFIRGVY